MRKCWICKRTNEEIEKDIQNQKMDGGIFEDGFFYECDIGIDICVDCKLIIEDISLDQADLKFDERIKDLKIESKLCKLKSG